MYICHKMDQKIRFALGKLFADGKRNTSLEKFIFGQKESSSSSLVSDRRTFADVVVSRMMTESTTRRKMQI